MNNVAGRLRALAGIHPHLNAEARNLLNDASTEIEQGWQDATIAWSVCASIHREYAKGKDAVFKTRQADFVKHEQDARKRAMGT